MRQKLRKILRVIVIALSVVLLGGCVVLKGFQRSILFPAEREIWRTPSSPPFNWEYSDVDLAVDGERTHGWFISEPDAKGTILFSHGNGGNIAGRLEHFELFRELGYNVFAYDYGGYGKSSGVASEVRCYADVRAAWRYLTEERGILASDIVLYGESLGGGPTCELAAEVQPRAIILQSTFISVTERAREIFPPLLVKLLLDYHFENDKKIGKARAPVVVIHSLEDTIIPYRHGLELFALAPEPKTLLELHGDHNDCIYTSEGVYRNGLEAFLNPLLPKRDATR